MIDATRNSRAAMAFLLVVAALLHPIRLSAQELAASATKGKKVLTPEEKAADELKKNRSRSKNAEGFYNGLAPLEVTLTANLRRLRGDKADQAPWRSGVLSYTDDKGKPVTLPMQLRTRGIWRLKNCDMPPLRLNFPGDATKGTLLRGVDKPKLVNHCHNSDDYEQNIIQEMQLYRVYGLLTPVSHRARLLKVAYTDSATGKVHANRIALLLEEPDVMAARAGGPLLEIKGAVARDLQPYHAALVGVFEYFIGNTDFSIYALHNIELVNQESGELLPVPYDFDFSGAVNAPYATVDPKLSVKRVRDRLFRGYCVPPAEYQKVFARFNEKKADIYALYDDSIGKMLKPKTVVETLKYFDEFYRIINDPAKAKRAIIDSCIKTD